MSFSRKIGRLADMIEGLQKIAKSHYYLKTSTMKIGLNQLYMKKSFLVAFFILITFGSLSFFNDGFVYARSGCCSHHKGVCGCGCCDGTSLSATCRPYYSEVCGDNNNEVAERVIIDSPTPKDTFTPSLTPSQTYTPTITSTPTPSLEERLLLIEGTGPSTENKISSLDSKIITLARLNTDLSSEIETIKTSSGERNFNLLLMSLLVGNIAYTTWAITNPQKAKKDVGKIIGLIGDSTATFKKNIRKIIS